MRPDDTRANTRATWRTYAYWVAIISVVFFSVYPLSNWLTSQRETVLHLYLRAELDIPLIPTFIWAYLSLYVIFLAPPFVLGAEAMQKLGRQLVAATLLSGMVFLIFPAQLGFSRLLPEDPLYRSIFTALFSLDRPHNMVPSLHVVYSALILLTLAASTTRRHLQSVWWLWLILLCSSTLLVHQHHLIDVVSGLLVAVTFRQWKRTGGSNA